MVRIDGGFHDVIFDPFPNIKHKELKELAELGRSLQCSYVSEQTSTKIRLTFNAIKDITFPRVILARPRIMSRRLRWRL